MGRDLAQLRILKDACLLDDTQDLTCGDVQLLLTNFQAPNHIKDCELIWAAAANNHNHLEDNLNARRNPNFICPRHGAALYVASQRNSLARAMLLVEAKAILEVGHLAKNTAPLFTAAGKGHLNLVRFLASRRAQSWSCAAKLWGWKLERGKRVSRRARSWSCAAKLKLWKLERIKRVSRRARSWSCAVGWSSLRLIA